MQNIASQIPLFCTFTITKFPYSAPLCILFLQSTCTCVYRILKVDVLRRAYRAFRPHFADAYPCPSLFITPNNIRALFSSSVLLSRFRPRDFPRLSPITYNLSPHRLSPLASSVLLCGVPDNALGSFVLAIPIARFSPLSQDTLLASSPVGRRPSCSVASCSGSAASSKLRLQRTTTSLYHMEICIDYNLIRNLSYLC